MSLCVTENISPFKIRNKNEAMKNATLRAKVHWELNIYHAKYFFKKNYIGSLLPQKTKVSLMKNQ